MQDLLQNDTCSTILCCGESQSGSTHTLFGPVRAETEAELGVVPRICIHILANLDLVGGDELEISFAKFCFGRIEDLLKLNNGSSEKSRGGSGSELLTKVSLSEPREVQYYLERGCLAADDLKRQPGSTVFTIRVRRGSEINEIVGSGRRDRVIQVVDAGEVNAVNASNHDASAHRENMSALAARIRVLAGAECANGDLSRIRESALLQNLLDGSLVGGNQHAGGITKCHVVGCVRSSESSRAETLQTLSFLDGLLLISDAEDAEPRDSVQKDDEPSFDNAARQEEEQEQEQEQEEGTAAGGASAMEGEIQSPNSEEFSQQPFSPESPSSALNTDVAVLASALREVETLKAKLKECQEVKEEELRELKEALHKQQQDTLTMSASLKDANEKLQDATFESADLKEELKKTFDELIAARRTVDTAKDETRSLTSINEELSFELKLANAEKGTLAAKLSSIGEEIAVSAVAATEIKILKSEVAALKGEKESLARSLEQAKVSYKGSKRSNVLLVCAFFLDRIAITLTGPRIRRCSYVKGCW